MVGEMIVGGDASLLGDFANEAAPQGQIVTVVYPTGMQLRFEKQ
jgi:hypothetical protein